MLLLDKLLRRQTPEQQAIEEYNNGLKAKYDGRWRESLEHNQRAAKLNPTDEATWWNLAIAATALHDWNEARRAWIAVGITPEQLEGEVITPENSACVRLVPNGTAEVVWGIRIDPARIRIMNVPLPESDRRYGDIILNDGAQEGSRTSNGVEYPVFNELAVWKRSTFSTFRVEVSGATDQSKSSLVRLCEDRGLSFEDWATTRILCAACSIGNPGPHGCMHKTETSPKSKFGIAAKTLEAVSKLLLDWCEIEPEISFESPELVVCGANH